MENTDEHDKDCSNIENNITAETILGQQCKSELLRDKFIYDPENFKISVTKPPKITGKIIQLRPAPITVKTSKLDQNYNSLHSKEPKFVPYEPYKGAVNPIIPHEKIVRKKKQKKQSTCSLPEKKPEESKCTETTLAEISSNPLDQSSDCVKNDKFEKELERLQKENQQLENQLKFQIQVNGDLKNLLVASVGEDMQTRVHILTEDKLHLARALLNSAHTLSTHQEQTEWLAGQCEVWRSKFLASSIMVEELAKWKALLSRRVQDLQDVTRRLLDERTKVREYLINTYKDLHALCSNLDMTPPRSSNILDLSEVNMQLSAMARLQTRGNSSTDLPLWDTECQRTTAVEALAFELIKHPVPELENADAAYSAVMGAAVALSSFSPACCGHCTGQIKTI
ncbi:golgin-45 isoform X2 [Homalodisca vitripennis]|nr:golgin-45 isoform X2 [Homalodisca vitripennis]